MPRLLSLAHLTVLELTPPEVVSVAAESGFRSVNLRLAPVAPGEPQHPMIGSTPMMRETKRRLADTGLVVNDVEIIRLKGDTPIAQFEPLLSAAAELGARYMLVAGDDPDETATAERFAELSALGDRYGVVMGLEFMPWTGVKTIHAARRIVEQAGRGRIILDSLHLDRSGGTAADIAALPSSMHCYFQLCDGPAERPTDDATLIFQARQARLPPGDGGIDLVSMVAAIPDDMPVSVEVPMHGLPNLQPPVPRCRMLLERTESLLASAAELKRGKA